MVQYSTKMIFAVLDVSLIMGLNIGETDKVFCINVGRGQWVMHDGMPYDQIQGQGHETFKVRNSSIF